MRPTPAALLPLTLAGLALPATAAAQSVGTTQPAYPGNELRIDAPERVVGVSVLTGLSIGGTAVWRESPTTAATPPFRFRVFVQDAAVGPACASTGAAQAAAAQATPALSASTGAGGFVVLDDLGVTPAAPASAATYDLPLPPFAVKPGVRRILLCAYQRFADDEVAAASRAVAVDAPSCRLRATSVRRGSALRLRCNVAGSLRVALRRSGRTTTLRGTVPSSGSKSLSTRRVAKGSYLATFTVKGREVGRQRVRIR